MRRWSAAAFFVGLALVFSSLVELHRWPALQLRVDHTDFIPEADRDDLLASFAERLLDDSVGELPAQFTEHLERWLVLPITVALIGVALMFSRARTAAGIVTAIGVASGLVVLLLVASVLRIYDAPAVTCIPTATLLRSPSVLWVATCFACAATTISVVAWLAAQRSIGLTGGAWFSGALVVGMSLVAATHSLATQSALRVEDAPLPSLWPLIVIAIFGVLGIRLALTRALFVSHACTVFVLLAGLGLAATSIAVEHDLVQIVHDYSISVRPSHRQVATSRCEALEWPAIQVSVDADEVLVSGMTMGNVADSESVSAAVEEKFAEMRQQFEDLWSQAGERREFGVRRISLLVEPDARLETIAAVARALDAQGVRHLQIISFQDRPERLWALSAQHVHPCAVFVELDFEGVPISSFGDWPALVRAADSARATLVLAPR